LRDQKKEVVPASLEEASTKSERSARDAVTPLGVATERVEERVLASLGALGAAAIRMERADDVVNAGVLCALPALLELGLLRHTHTHFQLPPGYYPPQVIFLVVALLALARVPTPEDLRYEAPGEWGKILGLDRLPEVKTLRGKLALLSEDAQRVHPWSSQLAQEWMAAEPESVGTLYVDGHVRVYHGDLTELPRRYVARQKLCLRGTTDYWVSAMDGQPFFVVTQAADPGLIRVLEEVIVPRLLQEVPGQPSAEQLQANPRWARFTLVFDRAAYSPEFFRRLWVLRVAVMTYHKFPGAAWAVDEFETRTVRLVNGEEVLMRLAERGMQLSNKMWVREVRHLDEAGHQTAILATDYLREMSPVSAAVFARWCQENFFKYMAQHYGLDRLIEYGTEPLADTTVVVNPAWRRADAAVRRERAALTRRQSVFGAMPLADNADAAAAAAHELAKGQQLEALRLGQHRLEELKKTRKETAQHLPLKELPESERFTQLKGARKHLVDTIKLMAYRAETALVLLAREKLTRHDDARALVREILRSAADLHPNLENKTLTVRLHRLSFQCHDQALQHLCDELTATETTYPGTDLRLVYQLIGATPIPGGQVV